MIMSSPSRRTINSELFCQNSRAECHTNAGTVHEASGCGKHVDISTQAAYATSLSFQCSLATPRRYVVLSRCGLGMCFESGKNHQIIMYFFVPAATP